jgi:Protein of unknown function (DUF4038)/Putative collagen-binding domain of a collagenase
MKMVKSCGIWVVLLCTLAFVNSANLQADDSINLQVSENGRFLVRGDGTGFFPVADTAWAIAWKLNRNQVEKYLKHRKDQNFNTIAIVAFPAVEGKVVIPNVYDDHAFKISSRGVWDPLHPITTPGIIPENSSEYDYWDHLEYIIDAAESKGMAVILLPAWGVCVAGDWGSGKPTRDLIFNANSGYQYSRWIGQRFKSKKNIIWMIGGDRSAVYGKRDYRNVFRAMAEGIADGVNGINKQDGKADYSTTLMSYHPRKWKPNSSEWFHNEPWLDFNSIQDQPSDQITATALDYGLSPVKPTWLFEGGYEFRRNVYKDWQIRFQSYQTVFAGGFGITYGSMNIYHFNSAKAKPDEPITVSKSKKWEISLDEAGAMDMQHLINLMTSMSNKQYLDRVPDQSLIVGDQGGMKGNEGIQSDRLQATRGKKGDYALVYSANGRNISLRMNQLSASRKNAFWFNPRNGKWHVQDREMIDKKPFMKNIPSGPDAPVQKFDPPGDASDGNDWVLLLK